MNNLRQWRVTQWRTYRVSSSSIYEIILKPAPRWTISNLSTDSVTNIETADTSFEREGRGHIWGRGPWPPSTPCWEKPPTVCIRATNFPKITQCNSVKFYNRSINLISHPSWKYCMCCVSQGQLEADQKSVLIWKWLLSSRPGLGWNH